MPCEAQNGKEFLSLEVGDNKAKETLTGIPALEAGKSYTYQLTVGKNKVKVNGVTVADWTTTEEIAGGKAEYTPYVTFTAEEEQVFKMTANNGYTISGLEYSVNYGEWTKVVADTGVHFGGDKGNLRLRGKNENGTADNSTKGFAHIEFSYSNVNVACMGDIRTLLNWENYKTVDTSEASFTALFAGCTVLTSTPDLPAMTLSPRCYESMFAGCTALEKAPDLPATELAVNCYNYMFGDCSNLSTVTMSAPSDKITETDFCCRNWLNNAGTKAKKRTLQLKDKTVYDALDEKGYLPANWQIGSEGTTVQYASATK